MAQSEMTRDDVMRETLAHVRRVGTLMNSAAYNLMVRGMTHDDSKFSEEEYESFAQETPKLKGLTYGSDEYKDALSRIRPAIQAHKKKNSHRPEYHRDGIEGMSLLDLIEMLADWKAAGERHEDGDIVRSINMNAERFGYDDKMRRMLFLTALELGYCEGERVPE